MKEEGIKVLRFIPLLALISIGASAAITVNYPENNTYTSDLSIQFNCSLENQDTARNMTFYIWNSSGSMIYGPGIHYRWCYQESANSSAEDCGAVGFGNYSNTAGVYQPENYWDADWDTFAMMAQSTWTYAYTDYVKPIGVNGWIWQVKDTEDTVAINISNANSSYMNSCVNSNSDYLKTRGGGVYNMPCSTGILYYWYCYDGSTYRGVHGHGICSNTPRGYEEGVWWNMSTTYSGPCYKDASCSLPSVPWDRLWNTTLAYGSYNWMCDGYTSAGTGFSTGNMTLFIMGSSEISSSSSSSFVSSSSESSSSVESSTSSLDSSSSTSSSSSSYISSLGSTTSSELSSSSSSSSEVSSSGESSSSESSSLESSSSSSTALSSSEASSSSSSSSSSSIPTTTTLIPSFTTDCSDYGLLFKFNLQTPYTKYRLNLSNVATYLTPSLSNVNVTRGGSAYSITSVNNATNYILTIVATPCTTSCSGVDNEVSIYIYGFEKSNRYNTGSTTPDVTYTPTYNQFTKNDNIYLISVKKEYENTAFDYATTNKMVMSISCQAHSSYYIDMKNIANRNPLFISTQEWPSVQIQVDEGNHTRNRVLPQGAWNVTYYLLAPPYKKNVITFLLQDVTGQFPATSYLYAKKYIQNVLETIYSKQFDTNGQLQNVELAGLDSNDDYSIVVISPYGVSYDFGPLTSDSNRTVTLTAIKPQVSRIVGLYEELTANLVSQRTSNPNIGLVGFTYDGNNVQGGYFYVYNKTNNMELVYNQSSQFSAAYFTFGVDINSTFIIKGVVNDSRYGWKEEMETVSFQLYNETNLTKSVPVSLMGFSNRAVLVIMACGLSMLVMLVATKTDSHSVGVIMGLMFLGIFTLAGWTGLPMLVISILITIAILNRIIGGE